MADFNFVEVNALSLSHPNDAYATVLSKIVQVEHNMSGPKIVKASIPSRSGASNLKRRTSIPETPTNAAKRKKAALSNDIAEEQGGLLYLPMKNNKSLTVASMSDDNLTPEEKEMKAKLAAISSMSHRQAYVKLGEYFSRPDPKRKVCVLLLDEVDYLVTKEQRVIYSFFDWPARGSAKLAIITVANTLDLPGRLNQRVVSRMGFGRLNFKPYSRENLMEIVKQRLNNALENKKSSKADLTLFSTYPFAENALKYCGATVANSSGDLRKMLQICRRSLDLAETRITNMIANASERQELNSEIESKLKLVQSSDTSQACKDTLTTSISPAISLSPFSWRLVLLAVALTLSSENIAERWVLADTSVVVSSNAVWMRFYSYSRRTSLSEVTVADFVNIVQQISSVGLLEILSARLVNEIESKQNENSNDDMAAQEAAIEAGEDVNEIIGTKTKMAKINNSVKAFEKLSNIDAKQTALEAADQFHLGSPLGLFTLKLGCIEESVLKTALREDKELPRSSLFD